MLRMASAENEQLSSIRIGWSISEPLCVKGYMNASE